MSNEYECRYLFEPSERVVITATFADGKTFVISDSFYPKPDPRPLEEPELTWR